MGREEQKGDSEGRGISREELKGGDVEGGDVEGGGCFKATLGTDLAIQGSWPVLLYMMQSQVSLAMIPVSNITWKRKVGNHRMRTGNGSECM